MFGEHTEEVMQKYLNSNEHEVFTLKEEFNTQRKIEDYFGPGQSDVKEGLQALV